MDEKFNCSQSLHFNISTVFSTFTYDFITPFLFVSCFLPFCLLLQLEKFVESDYHRLALQKLEACPVAMESLGAPPLKVHNIHLTDRNNHVDQHTAQVLCFRKSSKFVFLCVTGAFIRLFLRNSCHPRAGNYVLRCKCLFRYLVLVIVLNLQAGSLLHGNMGHNVGTK